MTELYANYSELRARAPCAWDESLQQYVVTRYSDVVRVLKSHSIFSSAGTISIKRPNANRTGPTTILLSDDPPKHTALRNLANKWFTPKELESMRPWIEETCDQLIGQIADGRTDLVHSVAEPLSVMSVARLLGFETKEWMKLKRWSAAASGLMQQEGTQMALGEVFAMYKYFHGQIEQRKQAPRDDLITRMLSATTEQESLSTNELQALCVLLFIAGIETTTSLISNTIFTLCHAPILWDELRNGALDASSVVEESLRFDSPVQFIRRIAAEDVEIAGCPIKKGDRVGVCLGAANRDPNQFELPDNFDPRRTQKRHIAFAHGIHFCLGAYLARMESEVVLERLMRRYSRVTLAGGEKRIDSKVIRGFESLPVKFWP